MIYARLIFGKAQLRTHEIDRLTMSEVELYLDEPEEGKPRPPTGARAMGGEELAARGNPYRGMALAERLRRAREED